MKRKEILSLAPSHFEVEPYLPPVQVEETILADDGITLIRRTRLKKVDARAEFKKYRPSDFALQNVVLSGMEDSLKPSILSDGTLAICDMADFEQASNFLSERLSPSQPITSTSEDKQAVTEQI